MTNRNTIAILTLGCKVNQHESDEIIKQIIEEYKIEQINFNEKADIYIINTCTVTNKSDYKSRYLIRKAIEKNPNAVIIVTGCYANTNEKNIQDINKKIIIIKDKDEICKQLQNYVDLEKVNQKSKDKIKTNHTRKFLKIQDGCNNFCTFCKVPYARGNPKSIDNRVIFQKIDEFIDEKAKEIVLTGINIGLYKNEKYNLSKLIQAIIEKNNSYRIRISSIEPQHITDEFIELFKIKRLCPHLHIPIQSASNKILEKMKRKYQIEDIFSIVNNIRNIRDIQISSDIMIGFPTEDEEDFNKSINLITDLDILHCHIFPYSKRENTKAIEIKPHIDGNIIKERCKMISDKAEKTKKKIYSTQINKEKEILIEKIENEMAEGYSEDWFRCKIEKNNKHILKENELYKGIVKYSIENENQTGNIMNCYLII